MQNRTLEDDENNFDQENMMSPLFSRNESLSGAKSFI